MRVYETMIIFEPELGEDGVNALMNDRVQKTIEDRGGVVRDVDDWGVREFAYEINHKRTGYYVVVTADAEPAVMDELGRILSLADEVVRYKTLRLPEHVMQPLGREASDT